MDCSTPASLSITNSWSLLKLRSIESVMPSSHLILLSPFPPAFNLSQHQGLFRWVSFHIRWTKYWSFSFRISPSNDYSGLISFRINCFDLAVQGTLKSLLQHHTSKTVTNTFSSVAQSSPTLCDPMDCSTPGFLVLQHLLELAQIHVHRVSDAIQAFHPLSSPSPAFSLSQHQGLFQWVSSSHQVAKVLELLLQRQSFWWVFRADFL